MDILDQILFSEKTPKFLKKNLDFYLQRNNLIASNIANVDTPDYKAVDIKFNDILKRAIGIGNQLKMKGTKDNHFSTNIKQLDKIKPRVVEENDPARPDGNNVKIEKEMFKLVETQLMYNSIIQAMIKRGGILRYAIEEGRR